MESNKRYLIKKKKNLLFTSYDIKKLKVSISKFRNFNIIFVNFLFCFRFFTILLVIYHDFHLFIFLVELIFFLVFQRNSKHK